MEIERKYLVRPNFSVPSVPSVRIIQGYPASGEGVSVRLAGAAGFLTLKGPPAPGGVCREEFDDPHETVHAPPWILREVTGDNRYANRRLALHPYALWAPGEPSGASM